MTQQTLTATKDPQPGSPVGSDTKAQQIDVTILKKQQPEAHFRPKSVKQPQQLAQLAETQSSQVNKALFLRSGQRNPYKKGAQHRSVDLKRMSQTT